VRGELAVAKHAEHGIGVSYIDGEQRRHYAEMVARRLPP
jgi:hypothetical protein